MAHKHELKHICRILGVHSGGYEGYNVEFSVESQPTFRRSKQS
jgi:hypothetical protein